MIVKPSYLVGGTFNAIAPTMQDGDLGPLQFDTSGNLKVNVVIGGGGSGSNAAAGPTGSPVPSSADYQGVNIGGTLTGVTGLALGATTKAPTVAIVDGSGNQIVSFGGGTQYATGTVVPTPTGTAALGWDGTDVRVVATDSAGQIKVLIENTPAVTISGTVGVTQSTSPWVVSLASTTITGNVNVVGTTTDGTTAETNFLVVGGESNDATAQYQPIPLGTGGRSVIIEGVASGTAVPISGSISFTTPQHVIVDSGTIAVTQSTNPWVVSLTSTTITGNVNVIGTTTDGTTTETNFLVVGGETNDATAQYQPIPLGTTGRSIIIEGVVGGTAVAVKTQDGVGNPLTTSNTNIGIGINPLDTNVLMVRGQLPSKAGYLDVKISDTGGNFFTSNSSTVVGKTAIDENVLSILGVAPTQAGFLDSKISDGVNGTVAVKPASIAVATTDPALVVAISPNSNSVVVSSNPSTAPLLQGNEDRQRSMVLLECIRRALVAIACDGGRSREMDFDPVFISAEPTNLV